MTEQYIAFSNKKQQERMREKEEAREIIESSVKKVKKGRK